MRRFLYAPDSNAGGSGGADGGTGTPPSTTPTPKAAAAPEAPPSREQARAEGIKHVEAVRAKLEAPSKEQPREKDDDDAPEPQAKSQTDEPQDETELDDDSPATLDHLDPKLVEQARNFGMDDEDIAGYDNKTLRHTFTRFQKYQKQPEKQAERQEQKPAVEPEKKQQPVEKQDAPKPGRERWKLKGDPSKYDEGFLEEIKGLDEYHEKIHSANEERLAALEKRYEEDRAAVAKEHETAKMKAKTQELNASFVGFVDKNPAFKDFFWKGTPEQAGQRGRTRVAAVVQELRTIEAGYESRGLPVPPMDALVKKAVMALYGERAKRAAAAEIRDKLEKRGEGATDIPHGLNGNSNGKVVSRPNSREEGIAHVQKLRERIGLR